MLDSDDIDRPRRGIAIRSSPFPVSSLCDLRAVALNSIRSRDMPARAANQSVNPISRARSRSAWARLTTGTSTTLPSREVEPRPTDAASSNASISRRARSMRSRDGRVDFVDDFDLRGVDGESASEADAAREARVLAQAVGVSEGEVRRVERQDARRSRRHRQRAPGVGDFGVVIPPLYLHVVRKILRAQRRRRLFGGTSGICPPRSRLPPPILSTGRDGRSRDANRRGFRRRRLGRIPRLECRRRPPCRRIRRRFGDMSTAAKSSASSPLSRELTRGIIGFPVSARRGRWDATTSRAFAFSSQGTESSMSGMKASGASPSARSNMRGALPGTNKGLLRTSMANLSAVGYGLGFYMSVWRISQCRSCRRSGGRRALILAVSGQGLDAPWEPGVRALGRVDTRNLTQRREGAKGAKMRLLRCYSRFLPRHSRFRGNDGALIGAAAQ